MELVNALYAYKDKVDDSCLRNETILKEAIEKLIILLAPLFLT